MPNRRTFLKTLSTVPAAGVMTSAAPASSAAAGGNRDFFKELGVRIRVPRDVENQNPDLKFNLGGSDCPLFEGLYDYCSMSAGSALDAARKFG